MGGPVNTRKYSLTLSAQAGNLLNDVNKGTPNGTLTAPYTEGPDGPIPQHESFGKISSLQGGPFSQGTANRVIRLQAIFSF